MDLPSIRAGTGNVNKLINKIRLIVNLLDVERLDLLDICETWLTSEVPSSLWIFLDRFSSVKMLLVLLRNMA